jgi:hypothetical protein
VVVLKHEPDALRPETRQRSRGRGRTARRRRASPSLRSDGRACRGCSAACSFPIRSARSRRANHPAEAAATRRAIPPAARPASGSSSTTPPRAISHRPQRPRPAHRATR